MGRYRPIPGLGGKGQDSDKATKRGGWSCKTPRGCQEKAGLNLGSHKSELHTNRSQDFHPDQFSFICFSPTPLISLPKAHQPENASRSAQHKQLLQGKPSFCCFLEPHPSSFNSLMAGFPCSLVFKQNTPRFLLIPAAFLLQTQTNGALDQEFWVIVVIQVKSS